MSSAEEPKNPIETPISTKMEGHREELVDHYWGSINYVFSLIKASEIKAGLILSFYGILLNLIYQNISMVVSDIIDDHLLLFIPLGLWMFCTGASIYHSIKCFVPRLETKFDKNIFFFQDIISKYGNVNEFARTFYTISLDEEELFHQLGQQIYINSKIASIKFKSVNRAIHFLVLALILLLIVGFWYMIITL